LAAGLSRGVGHARSVLTRTPLARPSLPLPHAYTSPCTAQLCQRAVKQASPYPLLNASCTALHTHHTAHPLALLSVWMVMPTALRHLLLLLMQVPFERQMWLLMIPTLPAVSQLLTGLQPLSAAEISTQVVQVPVLVMLMIVTSPALKVVKIAPVPRVMCAHCPTMMTSHLFSPLIMPLLVAVAAVKILRVLIVTLPMLVCTLPHRVTMMTTARRTPSKQSLAISERGRRLRR